MTRDQDDQGGSVPPDEEVRQSIWLAEHWEAIRRSIQQRYGDPHLAEEVAQDVMADHPSPDTIPPENDPQAWLLWRAGRRAIDLIRQDTARRARERRYVVQERIIETSEAVGGGLSGPEEAERLLDALRRLKFLVPPDHYRAVRMRMEGLKRSEIANELGKTERTITNWLRDAAQLLRRIMENDDE